MIVGAGQGGLSAAIHARLLGHDVLVLEKRPQVGGKAAGLDVRGFRLDPGPSIIILPRLYEAVFRRAGRRMEDYLRFRPLDPITRVYFEGQEPLDLPAGFDAARETLRRVASGDVAGFDDLFRRLDAVAPLLDDTIFNRPVEKPWQLLDPKLAKFAMRFDVRKTYRQMVDGWFASPLLRSFFYGFPSYSGQGYDGKTAGALLIPYFMLREGVFYPEGGVSAIPAAFRRLALDLGVEIRTEAEVTGWEVRHDRLVSVTAGGERIAADRFVANVDRSTVRHRALGRPLPRPSYSYFTLHWGLPHRVEGLSHHTLIVPKSFERGFDQLYARREFPDEPIVYLNDTTATDPAVAPPGGTNLFAVVTVPGDEPALDWPARSAEYRERTLAVMHRAGFLPEGAVFERMQNPPFLAARDGNAGGSLYGPDEPLRPFGGLFPETNRDPDLRNLFYVGGSVQPGAGLPMATLSGKFAAALL